MNCMLGASIILVVNLVANGSAKEGGGVSALQRDQRRAYWWPLPRSLATSNWIDMDRHWVQVSKRRMAGDHKAFGVLRWAFMCRRCPLWWALVAIVRSYFIHFPCSSILLNLWSFRRSPRTAEFLFSSSPVYHTGIKISESYPPTVPHFLVREQELPAMLLSPKSWGMTLIVALVYTYVMSSCHALSNVLQNAVNFDIHIHSFLLCIFF